ncbi:hypothetical protein ACHHV8_36510 [Paenibacillus sp. TAB 01]|uniref:hypothetical protein n=1 Tax=Paenibacillus sp. TAB 01 TaxID=3368988 RepID=UPI003753CC85
MSEPIYLRSCEVVIFELLKQGKPHKEILEISKIGKGKVGTIINHLRTVGMVELVKRGCYLTYEKEYEVLPDEETFRLRVTKSKQLTGTLEINGLSELQRMVLNDYKNKLPRSVIAKKYGMSKVDLNMLILQMGCGA